MSTPPEAVDVETRIARLEQHDQRLELLAPRAAAPAKTGKDWDAYAAVIASFIGITIGYSLDVATSRRRPL